MEKHSQAPDYRTVQQKPDPAAVPGDAESRRDKTALSDDDLGHVSAAGDAAVPTMNPEVLLGRHPIPNDTRENRP